MARKAGQIIARGASTWLVRVHLRRDPQSGTRKTPLPDHPWAIPRDATVSESEAATARQESFSCLHPSVGPSFLIL